jgi:hypothetical protein
MNAIRRALRERVTGGGAILSLVYLLVLQTLLASMAQGVLAARLSPAQQIICTAHGPVSRDAPSDQSEGDPGEALLRWHCATLCQAASGGGLVVLGPVVGNLPAPALQPVASPRPLTRVSPPAFAGLLPEARGPPASA